MATPQAMKANPMLEPATAYASLNEESYKAELTLLKSYQSFSAELLRLSLAGIAVIGFLYKEAFASFDLAKHPGIDIRTVQVLAACSILCFAVGAASALNLRYFLSDGFRHYLEGLRYQNLQSKEKAISKLSQRAVFLKICLISKAVAAITVGSWSGFVVTRICSLAGSVDFYALS
jgi:hypothetical protein